MGERKNLSPIKTFLSTGCTILDLAIAGKLDGGFPAGRISHIYGLESAAKTVFATEPLGSAQRQGGKVFFEDAEHTLDFDRLHLFGVDCGSDPEKETASWRYGSPTSIEQLFDERLVSAMESCEVKKPNAMAIDSLTALPSIAEQEGKLTDASFGMTRAKKLSEAFRKYLRELSDANLALVFVDQSRDSLSTYGSKETVSGGKALKFYSSVRVHMATAGKIVARDKGPVIGMKFKFEIVKNKVAAPMRTGIVHLLFDYGIDDVRTNIEWLKEQGGDSGKSTLACRDCQHETMVDKSVKAAEKKCLKCGGQMRKLRAGGGYAFLGEKFAGINKAIAWVEEQNAEDRLREYVAQVWKEVHAQPDRKPKERG